MTCKARGLAISPYQRTLPERQQLDRLSDQWQQRFWTPQEIHSFIEHAGARLDYLTFLGQSEWQGMLLGFIGPYDAEVLYLHVDAGARRRGRGRLLLSNFFAEAARSGQVGAVHLEVRKSNRVAQRLYQSFGMEPVGTRPHYYSDGEDALRYRRLMRDWRRDSAL